MLLSRLGKQAYRDSVADIKSAVAGAGGTGSQNETV